MWLPIFYDILLLIQPQMYTQSSRMEHAAYFYFYI